MKSDKSKKDTKRTTKKVRIIMSAYETVLKDCYLIVEVPTDCNENEILAITPEHFDLECDRQGGMPWWEEPDSFAPAEYEFLDGMTIEHDVSNKSRPDVVLVRDESGRLVGVSNTSRHWPVQRRRSPT